MCIYVYMYVRNSYHSLYPYLLISIYILFSFSIYLNGLRDHIQRICARPCIFVNAFQVYVSCWLALRDFVLRKCMLWLRTISINIIICIIY